MNHGFIEPTIETNEQGVNHILGAVEDFGEIIKPDGDWEDFFPDKEPQRQYGVETQGCTVWGSLNSLEALLYFKLGIKVNYSDRYIANMAKKYGKLDPYKGANPHDIAELIRKVTGLLREETCPWTPDLDTVEKYYGLTDELLEVFKQDANRWYDTWELSHRWVFQNGTPEEKRFKLQEALKRGTVCVSVNAWIPGEKFFIKPKGSSDNHWTMLASSKEVNTVFDSYDGYMKELDPLYDFGFAKIYYLTSAKPTLTWIQKIIDAITELLPFLKKQVEEKVAPPVTPTEPTPEPMPEPTTQTIDNDLYKAAISFLGKDASPLDRAVDTLGCAESVSSIINIVIPSFKVITGTWTLWDVLEKSWCFEKVIILQPGDIIICPTGTGNGVIRNGHTGIVGKDNKIMSNDSLTGLWQYNFTLDSWINYFVKKGGYKQYTYRLKVDYKKYK